MSQPSCPACGAPHSPDARFCARCGARLGSAPTIALTDQEQTLTTGSVLAERYEIRAILGRGGYSVVYGALDRRLNIPVAVKQNTETDQAATAQFIQEAQILARLRHPNLVRVIDYFVAPGGQFLVMEYVAGKDLAQLMIAARGRLPVQQVVQWGIEICEVLDYLHTQTPPIIHRDIKPANLKLNPNGEIIVIDLGIAKLQRPGQVTQRAAQGYTSGYAPLEQYLSKGTDQRTDVYALAATLYHLLGGTPPPEAPDRVDGVPLQPLMHLRPEVPSSITRVIEAALALRPEERPAAARELQQQLQRSLEASLASPVDVVWPVGGPQVVRSSAPRTTAAPPSAPRVERRQDSVIWPADGKEMVRLPEGAFMLGSSDGDTDEQPPHSVELPALLIDRFPVTNAEYARFVAETGHAPPDHWGAQRPPAGAEDYPVVGVSWDDARAYAQWSGKRLPSEAEWEKAARWDPAAGASRRYPWGDAWDPLRCNCREEGAGNLVPVGIYSPQGDSACGAADLCGNIWEWTASLYRPYPYQAGDGREDSGGRGLRVIRGGSWTASPALVRCANRNVSAPGNIDPEIGFRCVVDIP